MLRVLSLVAGFTLSSISLAASPILISAEQHGEAWPFTLDEVHLACWDRNAVVVMDPESGQAYALNGSASGRAAELGLEPLEQIWRETGDEWGTRVNVGPIIQEGLKLCR